MDLRILLGLIFSAFALGLLQVNCPVWSLFPAASSVYILGTVLKDLIWRK